MSRRIAKWLSVSLTGLLVLVLLAAAGVYWRLQEGPIAVPFLQDQLQAALDESLQPAGMQATFRDVVVEIGEDHLPTLRLRDLTLRKLADGHVVAAAPRASIALAGEELLRGQARVRKLRLVGAVLHVLRRADGSVRLQAAVGKADAAAGRADATGLPGIADGNVVGAGHVDNSSATTQAARQPEEAEGAGLSSMLARADGTLSSLQSLDVSKARIVFRDEMLGRTLQAEDAELTLRRVPYGFALLATARVAGLGTDPLPVELNAAWRQKEGRISLSMQAQQLELAQLLSGLLGRDVRHQVQLAFSARLGAELNARGELLAATAELLAGAGRIQLPDWLVHPIRVREGLLQLRYDPVRRTVHVGQGFMQLAAMRVLIDGNMRLGNAAQGGLPGTIDLDLDLRRAQPQETGRRGISLFDQMQVKGVLHVGQARFDIADLQFAAGKAAVRLRGMVRGEAEGMGIYVSGRARDISHRLLKELWPPRIGRGARTWLRENVSAGIIPQASMQLAIPASVLKAAVERDVPMPEKVADVRFQVRDVRFTYVDGWPAVEGAAGSGVMNGNVFRLTLRQGRSRLPSGRVLTLKRGEIRSRDLAAKVSPGEISVEADGRAEAFLELADLPPLRLQRSLGMRGASLKGDANVRLRLAMPFHQGLQARDIRVVEASAQLKAGEIAGIAQGLSLKRADLRFNYEKGVLKAAGTARLNDLPVRLRWQRPLEGSVKTATLQLRTRLDTAAQRRLGIELAPWLSGPVDVEADVALAEDGNIRRLQVRAGLDAMRMRLPAIGWQRRPRKGTAASFEVELSGKGGVRINQLRLAGPGGLRVEGRLRLAADNTLREATFSRFELDANNRLALDLQLRDGRLNVAAAGPVFDARYLISQLFAPQREIDRSLRSVLVRVNIQRVLTLRGEAVEKVRGEVEMRDGLVRRAALNGIFPSGRKVALDLTPARDGLRRLRIISDDAGALLRASGLYSRVSGGRAEFTALLAAGDDGGVRRGLLVLRNFTVRGDQRLARVQQQGGKARGGPRRSRDQKFKRLILPFSTDRHFIRIGDAIIRSPEIGATANGIIRRSDGAMDIGGTIIPAYALNAAFGKIPVLGALLTGGKGQGVFGMNYALKGTMNRPKFLVNPLSAVAPGVFRQLFHLGGQNVNPDGTPRRRDNNAERSRPRSRTNIRNGG